MMEKNADKARRSFRKLATVEFNPRDFFPPAASLDEMNLLIKAADIVDRIFWRQTTSQDSASVLALAENDPELREMVLFYYGPYDRLNDDAPFLPVEPKPAGAGFYPHDLTEKEFTNYLQSHPESRSSFESPYTVIRREGSQLRAVPYSEIYRPQLNTLSELLTTASRREKHAAFRDYLAQRSADVLTDDYYASESRWVRLTDNPWDLVIGPYEVYEDQLMGLKAAYEAMVLCRDLAESSKLKHFQEELPSLRKSLEQKIGKCLGAETSRVSLSVANLVYAGGDARKAIPAIAFSLPNDEHIVEDVGSRQVILKNVQAAKFHLVDWPIHQRLLQTPLADDTLAFRYFFNHTLFHEISHPIGPHRIVRNHETTTVNRSLRQYHSVIEEAKADTLAACFVLHAIEDSSAAAFFATYVAGFMRAIRFGVSSAHGGANAIQFNFLLREGAIALHPNSGKLVIDQTRARKSLHDLVANIIGIQELGDFDAAHRFVETYCVMNSEIRRLAETVEDVPVDIRIRYKTGDDSPVSTGSFRSSPAIAT